MENIAIIDLWKSYDKKLEENLRLNRKNAEDITRMKVKSFLSSMKPIKIFTVIVGILWVGFVDVMIIDLFNIASPFFLISAGIQTLLTTAAIVIYLYQLILIHNADISEPVIEAQKKIAGLKSSTLLVTRLLFLQLPVWTTFYLNTRIFENGNPWLIALQITITLLFTFAAVWLFVNIKYENRDKKWFKLIFSGKEWDPVIKSMDMMKEIEEYKN